MSKRNEYKETDFETTEQLNLKRLKGSTNERRQGEFHKNVKHVMEEINEKDNAIKFVEQAMYRAELVLDDEVTSKNTREPGKARPEVDAGNQHKNSTCWKQILSMALYRILDPLMHRVMYGSYPCESKQTNETVKETDVNMKKNNKSSYQSPEHQDEIKRNEQYFCLYKSDFSFDKQKKADKSGEPSASTHRNEENAIQGRDQRVADLHQNAMTATCKTPKTIAERDRFICERNDFNVMDKTFLDPTKSQNKTIYSLFVSVDFNSSNGTIAAYMGKAVKLAIVTQQMNSDSIYASVRASRMSRGDTIDYLLANLTIKSLPESYSCCLTESKNKTWHSSHRSPYPNSSGFQFPTNSNLCGMGSWNSSPASRWKSNISCITSKTKEECNRFISWETSKTKEECDRFICERNDFNIKDESVLDLTICHSGNQRNGNNSGEPSTAMHRNKGNNVQVKYQIITDLHQNNIWTTWERPKTMEEGDPFTCARNDFHVKDKTILDPTKGHHNTMDSSLVSLGFNSSNGKITDYLDKAEQSADLIKRMNLDSRSVSARASNRSSIDIINSVFKDKASKDSYSFCPTRSWNSSLTSSWESSSYCPAFSSFQCSVNSTFSGMGWN